MRKSVILFSILILISISESKKAEHKKKHEHKHKIAKRTHNSEVIIQSNDVLLPTAPVMSIEMRTKHEKHNHHRRFKGTTVFLQRPIQTFVVEKPVVRPPDLFVPAPKPVPVEVPRPAFSFLQPPRPIYFKSPPPPPKPEPIFEEKQLEPKPFVYQMPLPPPPKQEIQPRPVQEELIREQPRPVSLYFDSQSKPPVPPSEPKPIALPQGPNPLVFTIPQPVIEQRPVNLDSSIQPVLVKVPPPQPQQLIYPLPPPKESTDEVVVETETRVRPGSVGVGTKWAQYFGNLFVDAMSDVVDGAQTTLAKISKISNDDEK